MGLHAQPKSFFAPFGASEWPQSSGPAQKGQACRLHERHAGAHGASSCCGSSVGVADGVNMCWQILLDGFAIFLPQLTCKGPPPGVFDATAVDPRPVLRYSRYQLFNPFGRD